MFEKRNQGHLLLGIAVINYLKLLHVFLKRVAGQNLGLMTQESELCFLSLERI